MKQITLSLRDLIILALVLIILCLNTYRAVDYTIIRLDKNQEANKQLSAMVFQTQQIFDKIQIRGNVALALRQIGWRITEPTAQTNALQEEKGEK